MRRFVKSNVNHTCCTSGRLDRSEVFTSLGQIIRDAQVQGIDPKVNPMTLAFDSEEDGDTVDPIADIRADPFEVQESIIRLHSDNKE